jgi:hypothetical protein
MGRPPDSLFRAYVTRVGFQLTLTRPQMVLLATLEQSGWYAATQVAQTWFTTSGALIRKGLIEHNPSQGHPWRLTPAGVHVVGLMREAGLLAELTGASA